MSSDPLDIKIAFGMAAFSSNWAIFVEKEYYRDAQNLEFLKTLLCKIQLKLNSWNINDFKFGFIQYRS